MIEIAMFRRVVMLMVACVYVATTISAATTGKSMAASVSKPDMVKAAIDRDVAWGKFVKKFHKNFKGDSQVKTRYAAWTKMQERIKTHNKLFSRGKSSYKMGNNEYSDLTTEEYTKYMNGLKLPKEVTCKYPCVRSKPVKKRKARSTVPASKDWRTEGYVTAVKNQGYCGACWAFATNGALEGRTFRMTGVLPVLSEQNLIDCSRPFGNQGCSGGWMYYAYNYIKYNEGVDRPYDYTQREGRCAFKRSTVAATCKSFVAITRTEAALKVAVGTEGPIAIAVDASRYSFRTYSQGVYNDPSCSSVYVNHAMLLVGYGTTADGLKYWILKNSWGTTWGENGYIRLARDANNMCGIAAWASYPEV